MPDLDDVPSLLRLVKSSVMLETREDFELFSFVISSIMVYALVIFNERFWSILLSIGSIVLFWGVLFWGQGFKGGGGGGGGVC